MFLARIDGTVTATKKHASLEGARLLIGQRLETDGSVSGEPVILFDALGARHGSIVIVSTDGDSLRAVCGNNVPARMSVIGLVHQVQGVEQ